MIRADGITMRYGSRRVLESVSFEASAGEVTGLLGPNGAGKSTLLHILVGLAPPTAGTCDGAGVGCGFCPDDLPMPDLLTAREYLLMVQAVRRVRIPGPAVELMASGLRLAEQYDALIGTFSHGMKRKLQLIAALLHTPDVLVLDEPFRGLDPESGAIMRALITGFAAAGNTVLFSTHDLLLAQRLCQRLVVLGDGRVTAAGSVEEVVGDHGDLEASFLAHTGLAELADEAAAEFLMGLELVAACRA